MMKLRVSTLRQVVVSAFVGLTVVGFVVRSGVGTVCALGLRSISLICPLGALETMLASRTIVPRAAVSLLIVVLITVLLGRIFCSWICPVPPVRSLILGKKAIAAEEAQEKVFAAERSSPKSGWWNSFDSRYGVLAGALLSTAAFGFPVFCLICPVGLILATLIGVWRLFIHNEPTWTLVIFPVVLAIELVVLRKWCRNICPLGALLSLLSRMNLCFRPRVDKRVCLRSTTGHSCSICKNACPEAIDLHHPEDSVPLSDCTKCRECAESCPVGAIKFPILDDPKDRYRSRMVLNAEKECSR